MRRDKNFFDAVFLWKFLFWTLSIFKRGPDIRIFPTLSNFQNVNFIYTNFSRVRLDFIYSNAGWALFHANRSLFRIIWWNWRIMYNNYKIYYQYPPNPRTHRTQEPPNPRTTEPKTTEPKNHRAQEPPKPRTTEANLVKTRFSETQILIFNLKP